MQNETNERQYNTFRMCKKKAELCYVCCTNGFEGVCSGLGLQKVRDAFAYAMVGRVLGFVTTRAARTHGDGVLFFILNSRFVPHYFTR